MFLGWDSLIVLGVLGVYLFVKITLLKLKKCVIG